MVLIGSLFLLLAQSPDTSAYLDRDARVLVARARAARDSTESTIQAYTAVVKQRVGVALRTPLKDRTLYRSEMAARVHWRRDDSNVVKMLGARQFHPGSEWANDINPARYSLDEVFDPNNDRLYFGLTDAEDDDVWIDHPLVDGSEASYRFQTGETLTIGLPDGRRVRVVELRILPRRNAVRLVSGSVWIEPTTGAIVKAAYRLPSSFNMERDTDVFEDDDDLEHVPGIFKPFELDITMITVEYSYWRLKHWLPRSLRMEGMARAGILKAPGEMELAYDFQEVFEDGDSLASSRAIMDEWYTEEDQLSRGRRNGRRMYTIVPQDIEKLANSPDLPPPILGRLAGLHHRERAAQDVRRAGQPASTACIGYERHVVLGTAAAGPGALQSGGSALGWCAFGSAALGCSFLGDRPAGCGRLVSESQCQRAPRNNAPHTYGYSGARSCGSG